MTSYSEQIEQTARDYNLRLQRMRMIHEQRERLLTLERDRAIQRIKQAAVITGSEISDVWRALESLKC